jgi:multicomponent Na+:H+ antiporter subunit B
MNSLLLKTVARMLLPALLIFSVFILLRGHHEPGGGFIGGLIATLAFSLYKLAYGVQTTKKMLPFSLPVLIGFGLLAAATSGLVSILKGKPYLTGQWASLDLPVLGHLDLGTPLLFDTGIYCVVLGVTLLIVLSLAEE